MDSTAETGPAGHPDDPRLGEWVAAYRLDRRPGESERGTGEQRSSDAGHACLEHEAHTGSRAARQPVDDVAGEQCGVSEQGTEQRRARGQREHRASEHRVRRA